MKIIHLLLGKANPNSMNGVNKVVHHLATHQFRAGHETEVWGITATPQEIRHQHEYPLRLFRAVRTRFCLSKGLRDALHSLQPNDIVHMHSVFVPELFSASRILRGNGVPWVITPHGGHALESMKKNWVAKRVYMGLFGDRVLNQAHVVHAIGASEVEHIRRLCRPRKVVLIPNGQDLQEVKYTPKPLPPVEGPVFGFCGRLAARHKGLDLLIAGFASYRKKGGRGRLWLIGDGEDREKLRAQVEDLGVADTVEFFGPKFGNEKLNLIANMDVFVHTSRWEGLPMACLEAAALGTPLLLSNETNLGAYITKWNSGLLLPNNDSKHIAMALHNLENMLINADLKSMGKNSRRMIHEAFCWDNISRKLTEEWSKKS